MLQSYLGYSLVCIIDTPLSNLGNTKPCREIYSLEGEIKKAYAVFNSFMASANVHRDLFKRTLPSILRVLVSFPLRVMRGIPPLTKFS